MQTSELQDYGVPVWSPINQPFYKDLLATGSYSEVSQTSCLRLSKHDVNQPFNQVGFAVSPAKFVSLDWANPSKDGCGIIAGGMHDGAITLWNPQKIVNAYGTYDPKNTQAFMGKGCVAAAPLHEDAVKTIEFNPVRPNLLASGGTQVWIQDLEKSIKKPDRIKPATQNFHEGSLITAVSWNRVVPHILASASEDGKIIVWDLRSSKSIFQFKEPASNISQDDNNGAEFFNYYGEGAENEQKATSAARRNTLLMWNPAKPTQFVVANDAQNNSGFNIWDLRQPAYPVATYDNIHEGGILSMAWSPSDPALVVSSGADNTTTISNFNTGEQVLDFAGTDSANTKLSFSKHLHGKVAAMDTDGNTKVLSMSPEGLYDNPEKEYNVATSQNQQGVPHIPAWVQTHRPVGAVWGFGNKLISVSGKTITLSQVQTPAISAIEQRLIDFGKKDLDQGIAQVLKEKIETAANASNQQELLELVAMKSILQKDFNLFLNKFDIDNIKMQFELDHFLGKKPQKNQRKVSANDKDLSPQNSANPFGGDDLTAEGAENFFEQMSKQVDDEQEKKEAAIKKKQEQEAQLKSSIPDSYDLNQASNLSSTVTEKVSRNTNWREGHESLIRNALLLGNLEYAAEVALRCGRTTEALIIADSADDEEMFERIKERFFQMQQKDPFLKTVVQSVVTQDFASLITADTLQQMSQHLKWYESLAFIVTYTQDQDRLDLIEKLGEELLKNMNDVNSAILCFMLAEKVDVVFSLWKKRALFQIKRQSVPRDQVLLDLFEHYVLFKQVTDNLQVPNADFDEIMINIMETVTSEAAAPCALRYLAYADLQNKRVQYLYDRLYTANFRVAQMHQISNIAYPYKVQVSNQETQRRNQKQEPRQPAFRGAPQKPVNARQNVQNSRQNTTNNQINAPRQPQPIVPTPNTQIRAPFNTNQNQMPVNMNQNQPIQQESKPTQNEPEKRAVYKTNRIAANYGYNEQTEQSTVEQNLKQQERQVQPKPRPEPKLAPPRNQGPRAPRMPPPLNNQEQQRQKQLQEQQISQSKPQPMRGPPPTVNKQPAPTSAPNQQAAPQNLPQRPRPMVQPPRAQPPRATPPPISNPANAKQFVQANPDGHQSQNQAPPVRSGPPPVKKSGPPPKRVVEEKKFEVQQEINQLVQNQDPRQNNMQMNQAQAQAQPQADLQQEQVQNDRTQQHQVQPPIRTQPPPMRAQPKPVVRPRAAAPPRMTPARPAPPLANTNNNMINAQANDNQQQMQNVQTNQQSVNNEPVQQMQTPTGPPVTSARTGPPPKSVARRPPPTARNVPSRSMASVEAISDQQRQELIQYIDGVFDGYFEAESNSRAGKQSEQMVEALKNQIKSETGCSEPLYQSLMAVFSKIESGDSRSVNQALMTMQKNHWKECKDWQQALKNLISWCQKQK